MTSQPLDALLCLQDTDLAIDVLRARRAGLAERGELEALLAQTAAVEDQRRAVVTERDETQREEKRLDDEAQSVAAKAAEVDRKLYSGTVSAPKELQALQADLDALAAHRRQIEDRELDVMEQREALDARIAELDAGLAPMQAEADRLRSAIAAAEADIDAQLAEHATTRATQAAEIDATLLADYEQRRARNRGVGAARLVGPTCQACRLSIPASELDVIRRDPLGAIHICDNCGAILVPSV